MKRKFSMFLVIIMIGSSLMMSACKKDSNTAGVSSGESATEDKAYVPSKPVTITYAGWEKPLQNEVIMSEFMKKHENIIVKPYEGNFINAEELTKLAAANALPDIIAVNNLGLAAKNRWLIDLKPYFDADPKAEKNSYKNITDASIIDNKLFVLPTGIFLVGLNVNFDLIKANNLPVPKYDWTIDEAVKILKTVTVKGESLGCLNIDWWLTLAPGAAGRPEIGRSSVNSKTRRFEINDEWVKTVTIFKQLYDAKVSLWEQADVIGRPWEFEKDSPEAKAAVAARQAYMMQTMGTVEDGWAAGKTSMQDFPTYLIAWTQNNPRGAEHAYAGFNYDFYPIPKATKEGDPRFQIITDFAGITPNCQDPKAAYEFLKYITYDSQGYIDRVNVMKDYDKQTFRGKYPNVPEENFPDDASLIYSKMGVGMNIVPASNTDEARKAYREFHHQGTPDASPGISYCIDYIGTAYLDLERVLPGYGEAWNYVRSNIYSQIVNGNKTPSDISKELETGANQILDSWEAAIKEANTD